MKAAKDVADALDKLQNVPERSFQSELGAHILELDRRDETHSGARTGVIFINGLERTWH